MATKGKQVDAFVANVQEVIFAQSGILAMGAVTVGATKALMALNAMMEASTPNRDSSGKVQSIQNSDGSFKPMAGYDFPPV